MEMSLRVVFHIAVSIVLVIIYVFAFGDESMRKYREKAVIVTEHEEYIADMPQPGHHPPYPSLHLHC